MSYSGAKPGHVLVTLKRRSENNVSTSSTIYNNSYHLKIGKMCGRSEIQNLFQKLNDLADFERHRTNAENEIVDLFWDTPDFIELVKFFSHVALMNYAYKTNKYKMPLLEVVRVTSTNLTFSVAFTFLDSEKEDNYVRALQSLKHILDPEVPPLVIVTDMELVLMNALKHVFSKSQKYAVSIFQAM